MKKPNMLVLAAVAALGYYLYSKSKATVAPVALSTPTPAPALSGLGRMTSNQNDMSAQILGDKSNRVYKLGRENDSAYDYAPNYND